MMDNLESTKDRKLRIAIRLKEKGLELINTTGDILLGQEVVSKSALSIRQIKDFEDGVIILKKIRDIIIETTIKNRGINEFDLTLLIKKIETKEIVENLDVTFLKDNQGLNYNVDNSGKILLERIPPGNYSIDLASPEDKFVTILLDIK